jgi:hypothetical protein
MPFYFRKRIPTGRSSWLNVSKTGISASQRIGSRVTVNTRGRVTVRILPGLSFRFGGRR